MRLGDFLRLRHVQQHIPRAVEMRSCPTMRSTSLTVFAGHANRVALAVLVSSKR
jgi:hypothetical protein